MTIKLIGAVCIVFATTIIGFSYARKASERVRVLHGMIASLQMLEAEIMFSHSSLIIAANKISTLFEEPIASHYRLFAEKLLNNQTTVSAAWVESLQTIFSQSVLEKEELIILEQFATNLGKHDRKTEKNQIVLAVTNLERIEQQAIEKERVNNRMYKSLGTLSGIAIIIFLI